MHTRPWKVSQESIVLSLSELLSRGSLKGIQSLVSTILFMKNNEKKGAAVLSFVSRF